MSLVGPDGITPVSTQNLSELEAISPFQVSVVFNRQTGLGTVKIKQPGGTVAFFLTPLEARALGADLMVKSEGAITYAIAMRMLTEPSMGNMPVEMAVETIDILGKATRDAHNLAELDYQQKKRETANAVKAESQSGTSEPAH